MYTDGSFLFPNQEGFDDPNRFGSWAYVLKEGDNTFCRSGLLGRTNDTQSSINRCEMWAVIAALTKLSEQDYVRYRTIVVFSDSEYSVKTFRGDWILKAHTKNRDMIKQCAGIVEKLKAQGTNVVFKWIPGHSGNRFNDMADELAGKRMKEHYG